MRDLIFLSGVVAMIPFMLRMPHVGALFWCWTALLIPNAYVYGFAKPIPYNMLAALITLGAWVIAKEKYPIRINSVVVLLIIFGIFGTISTIFGIGDKATTWEEWGKFVKIIFFAIVAATLINNRLRIEAMLYAVLLSVGFHGIVEGLKFLGTGGSHRIFGPGSSILADNNHFALAMLVCIPIVFYLFRQTNNKWLRITLAICGTILFFAVMGTFSRGGLIGLGAIACWAFIKSNRKGRFIGFAIPLTIAMISFAPDSWFNRMDTIKSADQDGSFMGRVIAWKQSTLIAMDNPIFGGGFHAVQDFDVWTYYRNNGFRSLDFIPTEDPDPLQPHAAHSIYFQVIGDLGFGGLLLFLIIGFVAWRNSVAVVNLSKDRPELGWMSQLALYIQYSLVAYFVSGAALSMAYFEFIYLIFVILATLKRLAIEAVNESENVKERY